MSGAAARIESALRRGSPSLDGGRGIAILLVLGHNLDVLDDVPGRVAHALGLAGDVGWIGVQLFFVLSGLLITAILLRTRESAAYVRSFFARRVLRIFPLYYAALAVAFVVLPVLARVSPAVDAAMPPALVHDTANQIWLWTYLGNWSSIWGAASDAFPHFWSLSVEEQFYLVWPFVVRRFHARLVAVCVVLSIVAFGTRLALRLAHADPHGPYTFTVCRMDALGCGAAMAALLRRDAFVEALRRRAGVALAAASALFVFGAAVTGAYARTGFADQTIGYSILSVVFALFVALAVIGDADERGVLRRVLTTPLLRVYGKYSYGVYVFHSPLHLFVGLRVLRAVIADGRPRTLGVAALYMLVLSLASLGLAVISYHAFESRFLRLKDRFAA